MLKKIVLIIVCCLSAGTHAKEPILLILGDSLSAGYGIALQNGWVALLQERLRAQGYPYKVMNASISGDTTRGARARLAPLLATSTPDIVIIELGGNDGLRGIPVDEMYGNLSGIITELKKRNIRVLLIPMQLPPNYGTAYTEKFMQTYVQLAKAQDITLGTFILQGIAERTELMQSDGIHPQASAQMMMLDNIWPDLQALLKQE